MSQLYHSLFISLGLSLVHFLNKYQMHFKYFQIIFFHRRNLQYLSILSSYTIWPELQTMAHCTFKNQP